MVNLITEHMDIWTGAREPQKNGGRGRGKKSNGQTLYGIKKLRELILELAVRGKLVPQDPDDEPASVLLDKIAKEKARLIKEGKIKKQKKLAEISEDEKPFERPSGWEWARLGETFNKVTDGTHHSPPNYEIGDYLYITAKNIKTSGVLLQGVTHVTQQIHDEIYSRCNPEYGDILYIKDGATTGIATINELKNPFSMLSSVALLKVSRHSLNKYLLLSLVSPYFYELMRSGMTGVAITRVTLKKLNHALLPIPPLAEQHRIVAKVDELMALCDKLEQQQTDNNAIHQTLVETLLTTLTNAPDQGEVVKAWQRIANHFDTLFTTEQSIDQLKQTILQLAVMGKLVPQDPNDEPASVLLDKIAKEKAQLIKDGKIKKQKKFSKITEDEKHFDLPEGWEWTYLSNLFAIVTDGDHQPPPKSDLGIPFLVIGNLNTGKIVFENCKYTLKDYYRNLDWTRKPIKGDLLYTVTGSYGIPILIDSNECFCVQRHVAIFKSTHSTPNIFLSILLNSKFTFDYATGIATGIAQKTVPLRGLRKMPIPLPPVQEQHRIITKVDELMTLCDLLEARLNIAQKTQIQLADSIVQKAVA